MKNNKDTESLLKYMALLLRANVSAMTTVSQQLYTLELQLADAMVDKTNIRFTNKCLRGDKELVGKLVELTAMLDGVDFKEKEEKNENR